MTTSDPIPQAMSDKAADWFARRSAGLPPAAEREFQAWLASDSQHRVIYAELEAAVQAVSFPGEPHLASATSSQLDIRAQRRQQRRRTLVLAGIGLAAAAAIVFTFLPARVPPAGPPVATFALRPDRQTLPDGSVVELNAGAEIAVNYTPERRSIELKRGEALFQVAKNPARPFVVTANHLSVTAVGTAFAVKNAPASVGVVVTEGRVAVARVNDSQVSSPGDGQDEHQVGSSQQRRGLRSQVFPDHPPLYLDAGSQVEVPVTLDAAVQPVGGRISAEQLAQTLAWRGKRIEFTRTPLSEAAKLFNRENTVQLAIADAAAGNLRVSGIFWIDDPEGFVRLLESGFDLQTESSGNSIAIRSR